MHQAVYEDDEEDDLSILQSNLLSREYTVS